jgi:hypothetical protein
MSHDVIKLVLYLLAAILARERRAVQKVRVSRSSDQTDVESISTAQTITAQRNANVVPVAPALASRETRLSGLAT